MINLKGIKTRIRKLLFGVLSEKIIDQIRYIKLVLKLKKFLNYSNKQVFAKKFSEFYETETYLIYYLLKNQENKIILDIGANYGVMSFFLSMLSDSKTQIFSFEPVTRAFNILKKIIKKFDLKNVIPIKKALGEKEELKEIFIPSQRTAEAYISGVGLLKEKDNFSEKIVVTTLDKFLEKNNLSGINFIKCDVEGFELKIFKGAKKMLKKDKPLIFVEIEKKHLDKYGIKKNEIIAFLEKINYLCYTVQNNQLIKTKTIFPDKSLYFFIPKMSFSKRIFCK